MAGLTLPGLWLALLVLPAAEDPVPAELVARLGAPRQGDRGGAGEALVKIGREALPDLVKGRGSRDPEVRRRAEDLVARIEAVEALKATLVRLGIRDLPLAEAAEVIARESGMRIRPDAG